MGFDNVRNLKWTKFNIIRQCRETNNRRYNKRSNPTQKFWNNRIFITVRLLFWNFEPLEFLCQGQITPPTLNLPSQNHLWSGLKQIWIKKKKKKFPE